MSQRIRSDGITQTCSSPPAQGTEEYLHISCILSSVELYFRTIISGQLIGPIFKGQVFQEGVSS